MGGSLYPSHVYFLLLLSFRVFNFISLNSIFVVNYLSRRVVLSFQWLATHQTNGGQLFSTVGHIRPLFASRVSHLGRKCQFITKKFANRMLPNGCMLPTALKAHLLLILITLNIGNSGFRDFGPAGPSIFLPQNYLTYSAVLERFL